MPANFDINYCKLDLFVVFVKHVFLNYCEQAPDWITWVREDNDKLDWIIWLDYLAWGGYNTWLTSLFLSSLGACSQAPDTTVYVHVHLFELSRTLPRHVL